MRRWHLFEFGDQWWVPRFLRNYLHELLQYQTTLIYEPLVPFLAEWIQDHQITQLTDLASGAGGPWEMFLDKLHMQQVGFEVKYSDLRPKSEKGWHPEPVDILKPETWPEGPLTLFTGLHHLSPLKVQAFFESVAQQERPLFVAEFTERNPRVILGMLLSPILVWLHTPRLRPRRWHRYLFTYLIPIVPLLYLWDGAVSHARSYPPAELADLAMKAGIGLEIRTCPNPDLGVNLVLLRTGNWKPEE
ncbi:MAG TPA: hypothetical protein DCE41_34265 [Cytophagales bacterium]|nr:hypothetical protein [Cytophagales bacterium]HAA24113.1 hypothetical protein [Cytophagales bacterium]